MIIRRVSVEDTAQIKELIESKKTLLKEDLDENIWPRVQKYLSDNTRYHVYAAFSDKGAIGFACAEAWKTVPHYALLEFYLNTDASVSIYREFNKLMGERILQDMEALNRFQFYMLTLLRPFQKSSLISGQMWEIPKEYDAYGRYYITVEAVIPANQKPQYDLHWQLMGKRTWNSDLWIRKAFLKNEYLLKHDLFKKL